MPKVGDPGELLKCSFCGKDQKQVTKLIAGPGVYICNECIDLCNEIITGIEKQGTGQRAAESKWTGTPAAPQLKHGPVCPECRSPLADSALLRSLDIPMEGAEQRRTILFLACRQCGLTIDEILLPEGSA